MEVEPPTNQFAGSCFPHMKTAGKQRYLPSCTNYSEPWCSLLQCDFPGVQKDKETQKVLKLLNDKYCFAWKLKLENRQD